MTADPVTVDAETSLSRASEMMRDHDIGDVIVVEQDRLMGILTDRDIVVRGLAAGKSAASPVRDIATMSVRTLSPEDEVTDAIAWMREAAIRRVPVVDDDRPVGIVSLGDLARERDPQSALADISSAEPNN